MPGFPVDGHICEVKLYLVFLNFLFPTVNEFNVAFQATIYTIHHTPYTTIHLLHPEMIKLIKWILWYFVIADRIDTTDVTATVYQERENQVADDELEVGDSTRVLAAELTEQGREHVSAFCDHVRLFYCAFVNTLMKEFPFQSSLLLDLCMLNPAERLGFQNLPNAVVRLEKHFPQLQLGEKLDQLKTEAFDFQMAGAEDLPDTNDVDDFWAKSFIRSKVQDLVSLHILPSWYLFVLCLHSPRAMLIVSVASPWFERDSEDRSHLHRSSCFSF